MPIPQDVVDVLQGLKGALDTFIEDAQKGHLEMDGEDAKLMQSALSFRSCSEETYVIIVAKHKDPARNALTRIKCHKGTPLGGYTYDNVNECYVVECADHFALGIVPISFQVILGGWTHYVPMSEEVLVKYLNSQQKEHLRAYKAKFRPEHFTFEFLQLLH